MPQTNRSAVIKKAISAVLNPKAPPTIRGIETAPAYITKTCWILRKIMELGFKLLAVIVLVIYVFLLQPKRYI